MLAKAFCVAAAVASSMLSMSPPRAPTSQLTASPSQKVESQPADLLARKSTPIAFAALLATETGVYYLALVCASYGKVQGFNVSSVGEQLRVLKPWHVAALAICWATLALRLLCYKTLDRFFTVNICI